MTQTAERAAEKLDLPSFSEPEVNEELAREYGLSDDEYALILKRLNRPPSHTELGIFSVMWSEHCSYKTSRLHLKKLPTQAPWVIQGPGENAGVIDIGDGQAAVFKMESHNSPSAIEPYQGAATGVGGILRDVFTMGARPIASINALRFGDPAHPRTKHLLSGVVAGIAGYGNCFGVPTVGGETQFDASYNSNPLVNAMIVGVAEADKIFYARGAQPNQPVVYVGSKTGRDGIHGATMSSKAFENEELRDDERPTVQVGDPFTEKLLLEACLELMQEDAIVSIQDMGAAGLTSSSVEIAEKGGIGVTLDLDQVPQRELHMSPYEIMLSESQERMLMILKPGREDVARRIFEKWSLDFAVIGTTTEEERLVLNMYGRTWCDIPVTPLVEDAPVYDRPTSAYAIPKDDQLDGPFVKDVAPDRIIADLKTLIASSTLASKRWIWEQYDSLVMGNTHIGPGIVETQTSRASDAAIIRVGEMKALAISSDCNPHYCYAAPFEGGKQAVAESYRNLCASGATPLAVTNNLNFGNPERPEIMYQLVQCVEGMAEACRALNFPVISGNVSLYNETNGKAILPTPVIGGVGKLDDWQDAMDIAFKTEGETIFLIGGGGTHLGQSLYAREILGLQVGDAGPPPVIDLQAEQQSGGFILNLIRNKVITACHDISEGGLIAALSEMAMASAEISCDLYVEGDAGFWFGEDQARYVVTTAQKDQLLEQAGKAGIGCLEIGTTGKGAIQFKNQQKLPLQELIQLNKRWLKEYMGS